MSWNLFGRTVSKVGVIGSGQIGPDIALHFSKVLAPQGVGVVVVDVSPKALESGAAKLAKKVAKGVETGAFKADQGAAIQANVTFTGDYQALAGATLVIEAATEDLPIKQKIFAQLEALVAPDAILTSNSSHLEPERIFSGAKHPGRCLVTHYFFPAERNQALEICPHKGTDPEVTDFLMRFYERIGKVPVHVGSRYGYAVDPVFEGLFLAALLMVDEGLGTCKEVDAVAIKVLGQGVGPFTAMNLAGGNPLTFKGLEEYKTRIHGWFHSPRSLADQVASGKPWPTAARGEAVDVGPEKARVLGDLLLGAYLGLAFEIVDAQVATLEDLEIAIEIALVTTPPAALANKIGVARTLDLVAAYHKKFPAFPVPKVLAAQAASGQPFRVSHVLRHDDGDVAVLTLRRPRVLNALAGEVFAQIGAHIAAIRTDAKIKAVVITGHGSKAFAAGADVTELARLTSGEDATRVARRDQAVVRSLETLGKPVVAALNGLALGGGSELAQGATARIAARGLPVCFGQPEVNLGIIPGCGGTQRLPRLIGLEHAWPILRTGKPVNADRALSLGFVQKLVEPDALLIEAVALARDLASGRVAPTAIATGPVACESRLPEVEIGDLSREVDRILVTAIVEGAKLPLDQALDLEARLFGEVFATRDARIGLDNFMQNGPKARARFEHA